VQLEGLGQLKNPRIPGIEPADLRGAVLRRNRIIKTLIVGYRVLHN
jgi:hypothetical protein